MQKEKPKQESSERSRSESRFSEQHKAIEHDANIIELQNKCKKYRVYYKLFKHSWGLKCKFWKEIFDNEQFIDHAQNWYHDTKKGSTLNSLSEMKLTITQTLIKEDEISRKPYTEYVLLVKNEGKKWTICRKYKEFCSLHSYFMNSFPTIKFPKSASIFYNKTLNDIKQNKKNTIIDDRRKVHNFFCYAYNIDLTVLYKRSCCNPCN